MRQGAESEPTADAGRRMLVAVVGDREVGGRFTLATPLGTFVTRARDLGLTSGMRLLVRLASTASAGHASPSPIEAGAAPARTTDRATGPITALEAPSLPALANALLGLVPQQRIVLRMIMPAAAAPLPAGTRPAVEVLGADPVETRLASADAPNETVTLALRAVRMLAERQVETSAVGADGTRSSAPAAGDPTLGSDQDAATGPTGQAPGAQLSIGARGVAVAPASGVVPAVGVGATITEPGSAAGLWGSEPGPTRIPREPAAAETKHAAPRSEASGTAATAAPLPLPQAEQTDMVGLPAALERDERGTAGRTDDDEPGHVVIAVELGGLGAVDLHLYWTEHHLLVALAAAQALPGELRADLATALGRWRVPPPADRSDGADGRSLGR